MECLNAGGKQHSQVSGHIHSCKHSVVVRLFVPPAGDRFKLLVVVSSLPNLQLPRPSYMGLRAFFDNTRPTYMRDRRVRDPSLGTAQRLRMLLRKLALQEDRSQGRRLRRLRGSSE